MRNIAKLAKKIKIILIKIGVIFKKVNESAELKLDAFVFSRNKQTQVRALLAGTGIYITIPLEEINISGNFYHRFSTNDQEIIKNVVQDSTNISTYLISGKRIRIVSRSVNRESREHMLKIAISDMNNKDIEFEVEPSEISRNKFLLELFNKNDNFSIGYLAGENRIKTEQMEIRNAKRIAEN